MTSTGNEISPITPHPASASIAASEGASTEPRTERRNPNMFFHNLLLNEMREGVIFVDSNCTITTWNQSAEVLTGLSTSMMFGKQLKPSALTLTTLSGQRVDDSQCPFQRAIQTETKSFDTYKLRGRSGREATVELAITPVITRSNNRRICRGAVILVHDASAQVELQRKLNSLYRISALDPLTQVANRAAFEKTLNDYVQAHRQTGAKCCLVVCDIDHFKQINDNFGHHIGDQALIAFAQLLKDFVRARDIVARYGGEEFVILCANCDLEAAVERAEEIRAALNRTPQQMLNGKSLTASFGVAELEDDESVTEFFVRADQALYMAKETGRNRVCHTGQTPDELSENSGAISPSGKRIKWRDIKGDLLFSGEYVSSDPLPLVRQKLVGYLDDVQGKPRLVYEDFISFFVKSHDPKNKSRHDIFRVDVEIQAGPNDTKKRPETYVRIIVHHPAKRMFGRTRKELYQWVVLDLRRYLMINDEASVLRITPATSSNSQK